MNDKKKLLLLGGSRYLLPVIEMAHKLNCHVITCDYLPENDAHQYSDEYWNISIIDKEAVLQMAKKKKIDGIMSFACDPGVITASYIAEKMGLPFQCCYRSAQILQDKGLFREFLIENGFNCPHARSYKSVDEPFCDLDYFNWPVIVKPTDSAGSKGCIKVDKTEKLKKAIEMALSESHKKKYIIEDFLSFEGYHSSTDIFVVDGKIEFITFSDQLFDSEAENPYTPAFIIWPSTMKKKYQDILSDEIQRLIDLLEIRTGIFNVESCVADGKPYIMEISPRGGGCWIAELQKMAYGVNLVENEIRKTVRLPLRELKPTRLDGCWCEMVLHTKSGQYGILKSITITEEIQTKYLKMQNIVKKQGDLIQAFSGANMALGDLILRFDSREELNSVMKKSDKWLNIVLE